MATKHRITDTDKWDDDWFLKLSPVMKCVWNYLCDNVKGCGDMKLSFAKLSHLIGAEVTRNDFDRAFAGRVVWLSDEDIWVPGTLSRLVREYKSTIPAHKNIARKVIRMTESVGLPIRGIRERDRCLAFLASLPNFPDQALAGGQLGPDVNKKGETTKEKVFRKGGMGEKQKPPPGYESFTDALDPEKSELVERANLVLTEVLGAKPSPRFRNYIPAMFRAVEWSITDFAEICEKLKTSFEARIGRGEPAPLSYREVALKTEFGLMQGAP